MRITTKIGYNLELTVESENTKITETVSESVFSKTKKNGLGFPLKLNDKVDETLKQDVLSLIEDIFTVEESGIADILTYFWNRADRNERENFLEKTSI